MATIGLTILGSALPVPGGAFIGAFIGGIIDQNFLYPAIFGRPDIGTIEGPRLASLAPQDGSEGVAINYCLGTRSRVGGNVIWMTDLEEVEVVESGGGGGKGGTGGAAGGGSKTYEYYVSAQIAICEGPIEGVVKVFADGKIFIEESDAGLLGSTRTVTTTDTVKLQSGITPSYYGPIQLYKVGGGSSFWTDLGFTGTGEITITGYTDPDNNDTFSIKNKRTRGDGDESLTLFYNTQNPIVTSTETANATFTQQANRYPSWVDRVTLYPGASNDAIDSLVEADLGVGNTPRYKNVAKMVIERLALANYGNRLPQFNFVVAYEVDQTVRSAISDIMVRGGFSPADFDVTGIDSDYILGGYSISGAKTIAASLEPIMLVWDLAVYEDNGVLVFYERGNETTVSDVRTDDCTARVHGSGSDDIAKITERAAFDLPAEVSISYFDSSDKDSSAESRARLLNYDSDTTEAIRIPIWMDTGLARKVAETRLWRTHNDKRKATFNLPPRFLQVTEGDIVPINIGGETYNVRLTRVSRGANWLISCEGVVQDNDDFDFSEDGDVQTSGDTGGIDQPSSLLLFIFNAGPLSDDHTNTAGYYWAFALENYDATFSGGTLLSSATSDGTYSAVSSGAESTIFATEDSLDAVANPNIFDEGSSLDVELLHGSLISVNEIDLLNGANRVVMSNGEIIGFQTATSLGSNRYRLTKFLRGLRDTSRFTATHAAEGGIGVLLGPSISFQSINLSAIGTTEFFKGVSNGQAVDDVDSQEFTQAGCTIKPFSVANIEAERSGADLVLTWDRKSRSLYRVITSQVPPPLNDGVETYEVDLLFSKTVVQTFSIVGTPTLTITGAELVSAGYTSNADDIDVIVYQTSPIVGRGTPKEATV